MCVRKLKKAKQSGLLPLDISVLHYHGHAIHINGDYGVCMRLVVVGSKIKTHLSFLKESIIEQNNIDIDLWKHSISCGFIEYIDTEEQIEHCIVATSVSSFLSNPTKYTHAEVDVNLAIMGITANLIRFSDYNQSPRVIYKSSMSKQSIGCSTTGFANRLDSSMYNLHYPQTPFCRTNMENILNLEPLSNGGSGFSASTEAVLMIGTFDGFNQEDSILLNKASVDRGFARISSYKTYFDEINGTGNDKERFCKVESAVLMKTSKYDHLDDGGFAKVGSILKTGDVLIGKEGQSLELSPDGCHLPVKRDRSICLKEPGGVDKVCFSTGKEGKAQVRIRMRQMRRGIEGDKFASRHAIPSGV